ncbi:uncharacterized protein K02A2.6-like [Oryza brachyantha]|uniref:uncharacterized protein K02A2.6-like n=1 Tax=Oryza brachyantha TaxID=4533 RepID=UPI001ADD2BAB|nr:uncharacterized protein K02A2.6-like [Oryza brachyantha]
MAKIMVDTGAAVNLMPYYTYRKPTSPDYMMPSSSGLVGMQSGSPTSYKCSRRTSNSSLGTQDDQFHGRECVIGLFEWVVLASGLKSAGATYQRAMNYIFHDLIGALVIYIDEVVVKSDMVDDHLNNLRRVLERTRQYGLKMNPTKCAFVVSAGEFLGFMEHERGIEAEYEALIKGLGLLKEIGGEVMGDSQLVIDQLSGE